MTTSRIRVGLVFDLDDTLAPDTTTQLLSQLGVDPTAFWARVVERVHAGWDQVPAYLWELQSSTGITRQAMVQAGSKAELHPGVKELFDALRKLRVPRVEIDLECFLVSSGLRPVVEALPIAGQFDAIWASDFLYAPDGRPQYIKNVIGFTDKTRVLIEVSKGFNQHSAERDPFAVNRRVEEFRIPFRHMVFVGDGLTDIPAFALVTRHGGTAIAAHNAQNDSIARAESFLGDLRVQAIALADFSVGSAMFMAVSDAIRRIARDRRSPNV